MCALQAMKLLDLAVLPELQVRPSLLAACTVNLRLRACTCLGIRETRQDMHSKRDTRARLSSGTLVSVPPATDLLRPARRDCRRAQQPIPDHRHPSDHLPLKAHFRLRSSLERIEAAGPPRPTAAIPVGSPGCSCKRLTRDEPRPTAAVPATVPSTPLQEGHGLQLQSLWVIPAAAVSEHDCSCKRTRCCKL